MEAGEGSALKKDLRDLEHALSVGKIPIARRVLDKISKKILEKVD